MRDTGPVSLDLERGLTPSTLSRVFTHVRRTVGEGSQEASSPPGGVGVDGITTQHRDFTSGCLTVDAPDSHRF